MIGSGSGGFSGMMPCLRRISFLFLGLVHGFDFGLDEK
jgi:hypothetical protein